MNRIALATAALAAFLMGRVAAQEETAKPTPEQTKLERAQELMKSGDTAGAITAAKEVVEADMDNLAMHDQFLQLMRGSKRLKPEETEDLAKRLEALYQDWQKRFPPSPGAAYGMGAFYSSHEDPRARPFLLRTVELNPKLAKVWQMLSIDAERWGENEQAREYMHKAMEAKPSSPDYAFYWSSSWHDVDDAKWLTASLDVAQRFPGTERGAQALYWLGERSRLDSQKIKFWEQCRRDFPPEKFNWSRSSMGELFDVYLRTDPDKAVELAGAMPPEGRGQGDNWAGRLALAQKLIEVRKLVAEGNYAEAKEGAKELVPSRFSSSAEMLDLLRAEVLAGAGEVQAAYDALCKRLAGKPEDRTRTALLGYGTKLGKQPNQVDADVWAVRDKNARPAPEFDLGRYDSDADATISLGSLRGKVVFVTFWFPGCGPCRGEFPNFEHVVKKFAGKDLVYLGINGLPEQDGYVTAFMRGTRYSFTPLRGNETVTKAYNVRGYPENLLIDRDGRIVYEHFRTNGDSEIVLQRMIESLLDRPQQVQKTPAAPAKGDKQR
jgi:thiol-disulfide isomerase/thioredoxin